MILKNKIVIVTGAGGLLGREFVKAVVAEGGKVAAADIKRLDGSSNVFPVQVDVNSTESVDQMIETVKKKFGRIDAVVNSAYPRNKRYGAKFEAVRYEDFCENVNLQLGGYFLVSQRLAIFFKKQGHGNIINLGSMYATAAPRFSIYDGTPMTMPVEYAAIKAGVVQLTRYMANYFKGWNVRANCISPGGILDAQPKAFLKKYNVFGKTKGMLDRTDINGTLVYLLSDLSRYMNGQNLIVDDGWTL